MKGGGREYIIIYACACGEVDKLTYHLPPYGVLLLPGGGEMDRNRGGGYKKETELLTKLRTHKMKRIKKTIYTG